MKFILSLSALFLLCISSEASEERIYLRSGEQSQIPKHGRLFIERGDFLRAKERGSQYILTAKKIGETKVYNGKKEIHVQILHQYDYFYFKRLEATLAKLRGPKLRFDGKCSIIEGRFLLWQDYLHTIDAVKSLANHRCKNRFLLQAKFEIEEQDIQKRLQNLFHQQSLSVPAYQKKPYLHFFISKKEEAKYKNFFDQYMFSYEVSDSFINRDLNIETTIYVLEIKKRSLHNIGINLPDMLSFSGEKFRLDSASLKASLHAIEENGNGRILASPKIVSANGESAKFLAGGEIPIRASGYQFSKVIWKSYGIQLKVKAKADQAKNIYFDLEVEVSMPDFANSVEGIPGFLTNQMQSKFYIQDQEFLVLSGLIKEDQSKTKRGLPLLSQIPVLGLVFGSESYQNSKSELIIMVQPKVKNYDTKISR